VGIGAIFNGAQWTHSVLSFISTLQLVPLKSNSGTCHVFQLQALNRSSPNDDGPCPTWDHQSRHQGLRFVSGSFQLLLGYASGLVARRICHCGPATRCIGGWRCLDCKGRVLPTRGNLNSRQFRSSRFTRSYYIVRCPLPHQQLFGMLISLVCRH